MSNWITYMEEYKCNKTLLENLERVELSEDDAGLYGSNDESSALAIDVASITHRVKEAEDKLDRYIPDDAPPHEICRLADEKLFLSLRYICGMTMIEAAYAMCVSRDTVYRIRRRVLGRKLPD